MPVPNTDTFSLQDVVNEIAGTQTSLSACFTDANSAGFDPTYSGAKDRLSNFRNYTDTPLNLTISPSVLPFTAAAGNNNIAVTVTGGTTAWTAADNQTWIFLTGTTSSSTSGTTTVNVNTNSTGVSRFGTVTFTWSGTNRVCSVIQQP